MQPILYTKEVITLIFLGEPILPETLFRQPCAESQLEIFESYQQTIGDVAAMHEALRNEHLAIAEGLKRMGYDFRQTYSHPKSVDETTFRQLKKLSSGLFSPSDGIDPVLTAFPRDLWVLLGERTIYTNRISRIYGKGCFHSFLGEGGRVLVAGDRALCCLSNEMHAYEARRIKRFQTMGYNVKSIFPFALAERGFGGRKGKIFIQDHIDTIAALVMATDGSYHLLIDAHAPLTVQTKGGTTRVPLEMLGAFFDRIADGLGVTVRPVAPTVPYSFNFPQFRDGKVLMTSGEPELEELVGQLVGKTNVFTTEIPIKALPVFRTAGIRCLTNED